MKPFLLIVVIAAFVLSVSHANESESLPDSVVNKLGNEFVKDPSAVGLSVGIYINGEAKYYNFGTVDKDRNVLPTERSVYEMGSITKTFSAYLLAKAVIEKRIDLNDDIRKWLKGAYPNLECDGHPIRLLHLANLSSGLPDWIPAQPEAIKNARPEDAPFVQARIYREYSKQDFFEALKKVKIDAIPGVKKQHSNGAAQLLAYILEDIYGAPYERLVKQYITARNKMSSTFFLVPKDRSGTVVKGYSELGVWTPRFDMPVLQGAGGLNSSAEDMIKYIKLQLEEKNKIVQLLHQKTLDAGGYDVDLTWYHYRYEDGLSQIWFQGGTSGCMSYVYVYPELNGGVVLLSNATSNSIYSKLSGIAFELMQEMKKKR